MTHRSGILQTALDATLRGRNEAYGEPKFQIGFATRLIDAYRDQRHQAAARGVEPYTDEHEHAVEMILLKISRIASGHFNEDNYVDICGYAAIAAEVGGPQDPGLEQVTPKVAGQPVCGFCGAPFGAGHTDYCPHNFNRTKGA